MTKEEKIRVLMVDDEEQFRETTSRILSRKGYSVSMAGSGEEAIEILNHRPHDVVILDIKMPGMDGHKALSEIKKIRPETQVVMLTGHGAEDSAKVSLELRAFDYLNKPCDIDILASTINRAVGAVHEKAGKSEEKKAVDIMIHIQDYTTLKVNNTVREGIDKLMRSFEVFISTSRVMETGHRSMLVFNNNDELVGMLSIHDLIRSVRPAYLSAPKPSMADSMQYSAMFWTGLFTSQTKQLATKKIGDVMSASPPSVDENTNLMELADFMFTNSARRVAVTRKGKIVGVVREQELFFEMANIIL